MLQEFESLQRLTLAYDRRTRHSNETSDDDVHVHGPAVPIFRRFSERPH